VPPAPRGWRSRPYLSETAPEPGRFTRVAVWLGRVPPSRTAPQPRKAAAEALGDINVEITPIVHWTSLGQLDSRWRSAPRGRSVLCRWCFCFLVSVSFGP
jgi:hypothetical protein